MNEGNAYTYNGVPNDLVKHLEYFNAKGLTICNISISGGHYCVMGPDYFWYEGPPSLVAEVKMFQKQGRTIKRIALAPNNGWVVVTNPLNSAQPKTQTTSIDTALNSPSTGRTVQFQSQSILVKGSGNDIYVVVRDKKYLIPNMNVFDRMHYRMADVRPYSDQDLNEISDGAPWEAPFPQMIKGVSSPAVFYVDSGVRHLVPDMNTFFSMGYSGANIVSIPESDLNNIKQGAVINRPK